MLQKLSISTTEFRILLSKPLQPSEFVCRVVKDPGDPLKLPDEPWLAPASELSGGVSELAKPLFQIGWRPGMLELHFHLDPRTLSRRQHNI